MKINYIFLTAKDFAELYQTSLDAFSDYLIPVQLSEEQFRNHLAQNAVDLERSVGAFSVEGKMVGYTLNGFGFWNGRRTAYDAGTGIIPGFRSRGIGTAIFDFLLPYLRRMSIEQMLLEVIEGNEKAIRLYQKLGFQESRRLAFFEHKKGHELTGRADILIREIENPDWELLKTFWDGQTSWQFSCESIERKLFPKIILGAHAGEELVGYGVLYQISGAVPQIGVRPDQRRRGIATRILAAMQPRIEGDHKLHFSNVDEGLTGAVEFIKNSGFTETMRQFEMIKVI